MRWFVALLAIVALGDAAPAQWVVQDSGTTARLRGLCVVSGRVAWASGAGGTVLRTVDGGETWEPKVVPDAADLDFRDIEAFDERTAYALSIGEGKLSRIYKTADGGATWTLRHVNRDPDGFLDAMAFWDADHGLVLGDPVGGRFVVLATDDGGETWDRIAAGGMPEALPGEGAFAASGTCLVVQGERHAWFGTGAGRVFRSEDRGRTWTAHETPVRADSPSSGVFSLAFRDAEHGVAVGGDYERPGLAGRLVALTSDGGRTWRSPQGPEPGGYRSAVAYLPDLDGPTLVAVGPTGTDWSNDGGETWAKLGDEGFHAVGFAGPRAGWAVGEDGRIARFDAGVGQADSRD
ncbi:WD40/YVTN/BNR-like repeat-containing protein [Tautonia plasticadhaerens]|uniref:Ycf48-like protein n=1 Tax=Tautonia plasticadhaerens TaxID=2527974 RepID=A0A518H7X1_9BACT|nr:YCF48-related protein [Tautonia plasticadhaerens]QDV36934.1 Ycf48-like protein precursor [Tautonia plasticadhaerens]